MTNTVSLELEGLPAPLREAIERLVAAHGMCVHLRQAADAAWARGRKDSATIMHSDASVRERSLKRILSEIEKL